MNREMSSISGYLVLRFDVEDEETDDEYNNFVFFLKRTRRPRAHIPFSVCELVKLHLKCSPVCALYECCIIFVCYAIESFGFYWVDAENKEGEGELQLLVFVRCLTSPTNVFSCTAAVHLLNCRQRRFRRNSVEFPRFCTHFVSIFLIDTFVDAEVKDDEEEYDNFMSEINDSFSRPNPPLSSKRARGRSRSPFPQNSSNSSKFTLSTPRVTFADQLVGPPPDTPNDINTPCDIPMGTPVQSNSSDFSMGLRADIGQTSTSDFHVDSSGSASSRNARFQCEPTERPPGDSFYENTEFRCEPTSNIVLPNSRDSSVLSTTDEHMEIQDECSQDEDLEFVEQNRYSDDNEQSVSALVHVNHNDDDEDVDMCTQRNDDAFPEPHTPMIRGFSLGSTFFLVFTVIQLLYLEASQDQNLSVEDLEYVEEETVELVMIMRKR